MPPSLVGAMTALDPADRLGDVEVHVGHLADGAVGELLHPVAELLLALDRAARVGVEASTASSIVAAGLDPVGRPRHLVLDALQLVPAPRVRLVEVDLGAQERPGLRRVALAADAVAIAAARQQVALEELAEVRERRGGASQRAAAARSAEAVGHGRPARPGPRKKLPPSPLVPVQPGPARRWPRSAAWPRRAPRRRSSASVCRYCVDGVRDAPPAAEPMLRPRLLVVGAHQVERAAELVQLADDHADLRLRRPRGVLVERRRVMPLDERVLGDLLALVDRPRRLASSAARARASSSRAA